MISDPVTVSPHQKIAEARELMERHGISGLPVTLGGRLVGILTNRDLRFEKNPERCVDELMTKENLVTVRDDVDLDEAQGLLHQHRIEKLLVVDERYRLMGLITVKDIEKKTRHPMASKDDRGQLRVGAAVGVGPDREERVEALVRSGVDVIAVDTAHGHASKVLETVAQIRRDYPELEMIGGNVATAQGAQALIDAGVNGVKVGGRTWLHLHHPGGLGGGRAPAQRHRRLRPGWAPAPASRWCPTAASSTPATSPRRWPPAPTP